MTNYERITNPTIDDIARSRTTQMQHGYSTAYKNDTGVYSTRKYQGYAYETAIKAEVIWLNSEAESM